MSRRDIMNRLLIKKQAKASLKGKWGKGLLICFLVPLLISVVASIFVGIAAAVSGGAHQEAGRLVMNKPNIGTIIILIVAFIVTMFVSYNFAYGTSKAFLLGNRGQEYGVGTMFDGFKEKPFSNFLTGICSYIVIYLCFFIPSFIAGFGFVPHVAKIYLDIIKKPQGGRTVEFIQRAFPHITLGMLLFAVAIFIGMTAIMAYSLVFFVRANNPEVGIIAALTEIRKTMHGYKLDYFVLGLSFTGWVIVCFITCGIGFLWLAPYMTAANAAFFEEAKANPIETK